MSKCLNEQQKLVIAMACPERGAGNDRKPLILAFHQGPKFNNAYFPHCVL